MSESTILSGTAPRVPDVATRPGAKSFALYALIVSASLLIALNPLSAGIAVKLNHLIDAYLLALDLCLVALIALAVLHLRTGLRRFAVLLGLAIAVAPVAMVAAELAITFVYVRYQGDWIGVKIEQVYQPDLRLGWRLIPSTAGHHVMPRNFDATYHTDRFGRRIVPKAAVTSPTVHVFGTSFTFSDGVDDKEAAIYFLAEANRNRFQVQNYSVSGYGLDQMVLSLELHQSEIAPGDVVLLPTTSASVGWNWIERAEPCQYRIKKFEYPIGKYPILTEKGWQYYDVFDNCGLVEALLMTSPLPAGAIYSRISAGNAHALTIEHADRLIAYARQLAAARGARFMPLLIVDAEECRTGKYLYDLGGLTAHVDSLMSYCPADAKTLAQLRFPTDPHFNGEGNKWLASAMAKELAKNFPDLQ